MKLWGKIVRAVSLVMAAVFAVVAVVAPDDRWPAFLAALVAVAVALYGVPALVRLFSAFTGDEEVLSSGIPGSATITSLAPTGWRFNRYYPIVRFSLTIEASGAACPVELKQVVDPELLDRLAPGVVVAVRVDRENHKKVVIDWRAPIQGSRGAAGGESAEQQATATQSSSDQPAKRSLLPFLRWGLLIFGLVFFRLSYEEGYYEKGGARVQYDSYRFTTKEGRAIEGRYDVLPGTWQN